MNETDILAIAAEYSALLRSRGLTPEEFPDLDRSINPCDANERDMLLRHVLWAVERIPHIIDRLGGLQYSLRWIGCAQGALVAYGILTIAQSRQRFSAFLFQSDHFCR